MFTIIQTIYNALRLLFDWLSTGVVQLWGWFVWFLDITNIWGRSLALYNGLWERMGTYTTEYIGGIFGDTTNSIFGFLYYVLGVDYALFFIRILVGIGVSIISLVLNMILHGLLILSAMLVFRFVMRIIRLSSGGTLNP